MPTREFSCQSAGHDCDFMIRSENEDELLEVVKSHGSEVHDKTLSNADIKDAWTTV